MKVLLPGITTAVVLGASANSYRQLSIGQTTSLTTEAHTQLTYRTAGVLSKMLVVVTANDRGASTFRSRKGGANGNMVNASISGTGEFKDDTNTDTVTAGDLWNSYLVTGAGGTTFISRGSSFQFAASSNTVSVISSNNSLTHTTNNQTIFIGLSFTSGTPTTTEAVSQAKMKTAGVFKNLAVNVITNTRTTTTTCRVRINGANGNIFTSYLTTVTGVQEDTSNTDTVAIDDLVGGSIVFGADANNFRMRTFKIEFETTNNKSEFLSSDPTGIVIAASATGYHGIAGGLMTTIDTTETNVQMSANIGFTASKLACYVGANTIVGDSSLKLRADAANLNQSVTITGLGANAWYEDSSNTDIITSTQKINYMSTGGAAGTSLALHSIGMLVDYGGDVGSTNHFLSLLGAG